MHIHYAPIQEKMLKIMDFFLGGGGCYYFCCTFTVHVAVPEKFVCDIIRFLIFV